MAVIMSDSPWIYRAVLYYCLETPSGMIDSYTISAVIGASVQAVERVCKELVQTGILAKLEDKPRPLFQVMEYGRQVAALSYRSRTDQS